MRFRKDLPQQDREDILNRLSERVLNEYMNNPEAYYALVMKV